MASRPPAEEHDQDVTQTKVARIGKRYPRALPAAQPSRSTGLAARLLAWLVALLHRLGL